MDTYRTLLVNFDASLQMISGYFLKRPGYVTVLANSFSEAFQQLGGTMFDLVILNLRQPNLEDKLFISEVCEKYPNSTLVVLADQKSFEVVLQLFRLGVRDYILKSEGMDIILKRLLTVLEEVGRRKRRQNYLVQIQNLLTQLKDEMSFPAEGRLDAFLPFRRDDSRYLRRGEFIVDLNTRQVIYKERTVVLTQGTFNYFMVLIRHAPSPVQHRTLVFEAQGYEVLNGEALGIAKWHIHQLRSTFKSAFGEDLIETIRGTGYRVKVSMEIPA
jgi:DNA-binding response OmpR family regulator